MHYLFVTENYENNNNILYISENLSSLIFKNENKWVTADRNRVCIGFCIEDDLLEVAEDDLIDKISDIIAINYKYHFFENRLKTMALSSKLREILLIALISADVNEDKRYLRSKINKLSEIAIDGLYNFRLNNLKEKWDDICSFIPEFFSERELCEFIRYLIGGKKKIKILVDGNKVFDRRGLILKKSSLVPNQSFKTLKEILLSGATQIEVEKMPYAEEEQRYIKEFFGDKILFKSSEIL